MIQAGSIYCNEEKITDLQKVFSKDETINWIFLLRKWKKVNRTVIVK
jgi:hypothetical protein